MLKTTIPTLEIKTSGADLSLAETMYVTIKKENFQTVKSNDDIEVDNDVVSVSLSQDESSAISGADGISVSIMAVGYDSSVYSIKITWAKRGSRTSYDGSGGGGGGGSSGSDKLWYPSVSANGILTWTKSESSVAPAPADIKGEPGKDGKDGTPGQNGKNGTDGFSPTITENAGNSPYLYKLDITTKDSSFTTPNLIGHGEGDVVKSFNGRAGDVNPVAGDYTAQMVGAATIEQVMEAIQDAVLESWGASY